MQVEGRRLRADPRDRDEVVPRRRAGGGPLQRSTPAPRVVDLHHRGLTGHVEVVEERHHRGGQQERPDRRDLVQRREAVPGQVVGVATGHPLHPEPVLDQEGGVKADEQQPEVHLAQSLVEHPAGELGPPEVEPGEHREHHRAEDHVVEVRHHEVGVRDVEVQRRAGQDHPGQATEEEGGQEAERPQHGRVEGDRPAPHSADPVEELHSCGHRDQEGHAGEERQAHRTGDEHVVGPHRHREHRDRHRGPDQTDVAEDRLSAEDRQDLGHDPEEGQRDDVDLRMPEEPEQVLPQDRPAVGGVEHVGAAMASAMAVPCEGIISVSTVFKKRRAAL